MTKLLNIGHKKQDKKYDYNQVKTWSTAAVPGKDLFLLDKIFFPIHNGNAHWTLAVVFMQEKRIQMYDSLSNGSEEGAQIYLKAIFQYLRDDHVNKKKCEMPCQKEWTLGDAQEDTPQQTNGMLWYKIWTADNTMWSI